MKLYEMDYRTLTITEIEEQAIEAPLRAVFGEMWPLAAYLVMNGEEVFTRLACYSIYYARLSELSNGVLATGLGTTDVFPALEREIKAQDTEEKKRKWLGVWTAAPDAFDGFGTFTDETVNRRRAHASGCDYRLVWIDPQHYEWQRMRYSSGGYCYYLQDVFDSVYGDRYDELEWSRV